MCNPTIGYETILCMDWLSDALKQEIRKLFEPKYKHKLSDEEVIAIANNLTGLLEAYFKMRWRQKYGAANR